MSYVCVDVDGVILNFNDGLSRYLKDTRNIDFDTSKCINYDYRGLNFDRKIVYECFKEVQFYEYLEYFDGAVESLKYLQNFLETKAYTGSVDISEIVVKRENLCDELGLFGKPFIGRRKETDFEAVALFDDCLCVHKQWISDGSQAKLFLIDAPYNQQTDENKSSLDWSRIIRCKNFKEAVERFLTNI